ncbi:hypothetical protein LXL04_021866 [Taraxacum kok-saghyz]
MPPKPENMGDELLTIEDQLQGLLRLTTATNTKLDTLSTNMANLVTILTNQRLNQPPPPPPPPPPPHPPNLRPTKILLPNFDGSNPLDWLFQANNYFEYYAVAIDQRVTLSVFYFNGDALSWYKYLASNQLLGTWPDFSRQLELHFGPSTFENHQATLFKLQPTTTVAAYQTEFERVSNCVTGLDNNALLNCFLSGLKTDIQSELAIHQPSSLHHAYGLAKLVEDKTNQQRSRFTYSRSHTFQASATPSTTVKTAAATNHLLPTPTTPKLPFNRLSPEALQKRRADGLCFRCPEKYVPGHKCNPPKFLLLVDNDDQLDIETPTDTLDSDEMEPLAQAPHLFALSTAAFFGLNSPQALRITGYIQNQPVTILIDCGSTHNIIQPRIVHMCNLIWENIPAFSVMVGNGDSIKGDGFCNDLLVRLANKDFTIPFFVLPVERADLILGLAWLRTLGPILADFSVTKLTFTMGQQTITLQGEPMSKKVNSPHLKTLLYKETVASLHAIFFHISPDINSLTTNHKTTSDHTITSIIHQYATIFDKPKNLPPFRSQNHHISTSLTASPVNVRPYRYPYYQKQVMTALISEMLADGIIKPSHSPYSSPVLLVKKKTVHGVFVLITVHSTLSLLKTVAPPDTHKTAFRTVDGHYEFLVMPFGLSNAPSTFQSTMNDLFRNELRKFVLVFFDDILVYSPDSTQHYKHLHHVLDTLARNHFHAKQTKCTFGVATIDYLGHIISAEGVTADPDKITGIQNWPPPTSITALRGFLGLTGYYRRFVRHYAHIASVTPPDQGYWRKRPRVGVTSYKYHNTFTYSTTSIDIQNVKY